MTQILQLRADSMDDALARVHACTAPAQTGAAWTTDGQVWQVELITPDPQPMTRDEVLAAIDAGESLRVESGLLLLGDPAMTPPIDLVKTLLREGVLEQVALAADYSTFQRTAARKE